MEIMEISPYECCVCGYTKTLMSHYSFSLHSIPAKTEELAYAWESATGINKILFLQGAKVCSRHFFECDFSPTAITRELNSNAIPSNYLELTIQDTYEELVQEEYLNMADRGMSLNNPSTNQDFKTNPVFKDQNSEQPKQFIDTFVDFLKSSSSYITSTLNEASTTESSHTETMNAIPDENSRIDFHNQPSTSKQLFTIIKPTITTQTDLMIHYYDIDPLTFDNQDQGAIKRPRLN